MSGAEERERRTALIVTTLVKFYVAVELSGAGCPLCGGAAGHDEECPLSLAWSLLSAGQRGEVRRAVRASALAVGRAEEWPDTLTQ